ncbi:MAG: N-acetylmuramate alpha-1-phosphate uridylyltransferase MurU [Gammaproteobacteria bacterium]
MRAMILAAGRGKRLQPLTDTLPKPLVPIAGHPLIEYTIKRLANYGIREIVINVAYMGQKIMHELGNGEKYGVQISYSIESEPLEVAGGIIHALPLLGTDPFLVVNGDIWTDYPFVQLIQKAKDFKGQAHLVLVDNSPKHPHGDFGLDGDKLLSGDVKQKFTYSGIALYTAEFFAGYTPGPRVMRPLFEAAIVANTITGEYYAGEWSDIGTLPCWQKLNERLGHVTEL